MKTMWKRVIISVMAGVCFVAAGSGNANNGGTVGDTPEVPPNDFLLQHNHAPHRPPFQNYRSHSQGFQHSPQFHRAHGNFPPDFEHDPGLHSSHIHPPIHNSPYHHDGRETNSQDRGRETVPEDVETTYSNSSTTIPLDFIKNISEYSVNDLLLNFVEGGMDYDDDDGPPFIGSRFGDDNIARNAAILPKKAGCIPEYRTLKLASTDDPSILYIPQCTRIEQCGGCCNHALLECQPIETETLAFQVVKTQYTGTKKLKILGKEIIPVEKHTKCKCDCKIKAEVATLHCNQYQEYKPDECRCTCKNTDEEQKCRKSGSKKLWNPELCACQCKDVIICTTGYYFDQNDCKCSASPMRRRYATYETKGSNPEDVAIIPLKDDKY
ncbi:uncharacterized protein isoform X3 [Leptinotarsa decemlineata]|uniref:uncharacterized protein isoform X3 n=1 Tax=Leptinotarsa decemlineata TaxID=7539 RepID=UPI003D3070B7